MGAATTASEAAEPERDRGRDAPSPGAIPLLGWRDVLLRVSVKVRSDNLALISAGVAYYGLFAVFPALAALISIYGLIADPVDAERQVAALPALPGEARRLLMDPLQRVAGSSGPALGSGLIASLLVSVYAATRGLSSLILALNIAYGEREQHGFFKQKAISFAFTLGAILLGIGAIAITVAAPVVLAYVPLDGASLIGLAVLPWFLLAGSFFSGVTLLYRYGPNRRPARWRWLAPGAGLSTALWLAASVGLSVYVTHFQNYNRVYGSVGAVIVLLVWFYLTAYIVMLGAELNAELEHQTRVDTTRGPEKPMGQRGAHVADTLGEVPRRPWRGWWAQVDTFLGRPALRVRTRD